LISSFPEIDNKSYRSYKSYRESGSQTPFDILNQMFAAETPEQTEMTFRLQLGAEGA
jgi:hypothetical protein